MNSLHNFSSWLSIMFFRHDFLSKSNDLHVSSSCFSSCFSLCFSSCFSLCFSSWLSTKKIMQKDNAKVEKISIFNSLDVKLKFLMSRVELTQFSVESSHVKLKIWATWLESSWKCEQFDSISIRVQNVNSKLNLMINLSKTCCSELNEDNESLYVRS